MESRESQGYSPVLDHLKMLDVAMHCLVLGSQQEYSQELQEEIPIDVAGPMQENHLLWESERKMECPEEIHDAAGPRVEIHLWPEQETANEVLAMVELD